MSFLRSWLSRLGLGFRKSPDRAAARLEEAQRAFVENDGKRADRLAASALRSLGDSVSDARALAVGSTLHALRGGIAVRENRLDDALEHFGRSLEWARRSERTEAVVAALLNLIDVHTRRETFAEADGLIEEAAAATIRGTQYADALGKLAIERGVAQTRAGHLPGALLSFDRAIEANPEWPFPWYQRAWARFLSGDSGGALDDYRECARRKGVFFTVQREIRCLEDVAAGHVPLEVFRAFCFVRDRVHDKPEAVEETCRRILERCPDFAPAHLLRAEVRLAFRDVEGAREAAREALSHDPDPDTAAAALFLEWNISRQRGDLEAARIAAERLEMAYRGHPATAIVAKIRDSPNRDMGLRWTFALDGSLHFEEVPPSSIIRPDRAPPPPGPPGSGS